MNEHNEKVLKEALEILRKEEDAKILLEMEEAKKIPEFQVKEGEAERFLQQLEKNEAKKKHAKSRRTWLRAASIILVVAISAAVVTISVDGFFEKFTSFFTNFTSSEYASVKVGSEDDMFLSYNGQFVPTVLPKGYVVEAVNNGSNKYEILLKNKNKCMIVLKEQSEDLKSNFDTEDAEAVKDITIKGVKGLYVEKGNLKKIAFCIDSVMLVITTDDPDLDLIGFAELIEKR